jgi:REP element-mobilizing transposase RayT
MKFDPLKHNRRSTRLQGYDYTQPGAYFVTLVTWQRYCLFGEIVHGMMQLNPIGKIIQSEWQRLPRHFHNIRLDAFMVMPNHVHGTIVIESVATRQPPYEIPDSNHPMPDQMNDCPDGSPLPSRSPLQTTLPNGPMPNSLGAMIGQFKSRATKRIWSLPGMDHCPIWQRNYYEHIVRDDQDFINIWNYIDTNPQEWQEDQLHPSVMLNPINQD